MIHHYDILEEIKKKRQDGSFIYPDYGRYSIAEIPQTVLSFFGVPTQRKTLQFDALKEASAGRNNLLFFFIDGYSYDHYIEFEKELPFFGTLGDSAHVYPLTSVFPSTTAAALTTLQTGLTPQEHGLPEWTVYLEELDRISFGTLRESEGAPEILYEGKTLYRILRDNGVTPWVFTYAPYFPSSYSSATQEGAEVMPYKDMDDLFYRLEDTMKKAKGKNYFFVYWGHVDTVEHMYGPKSPEHMHALQEICEYLENRFKKKLDPRVARETLMIMSSDHGQANIKNEDIIYLNSYINLDSSYFRTPSKKMVAPTGAPHDVFLHIDEPKVQFVLEYLQTELKGKAEVLLTEEAVRRGIFGLNTATKRFLRRIGNILILPYEGYHIWYQHTPNAFWHQLGIHGGLSRQEMLVPLVVIDLEKLSKQNGPKPSK
jgi:hypothetical protein